MSTWTLIIVASLASYLLRALPILFFHRFPISEQGALYRFLSYAAFAVMGGIIYSALLGNTHYQDWQGHFDEPATLLRLVTLVLAVIIAARWRGIFRTLFICLGFFMAMSLITGA